MTHANLLYDPDWKAVHDRHATERARSSEELHRLAVEAITSEVYRQVKAECERHNQACFAALKAQHPTVQDYAAWLFREFKVSADDWEGAIPMPVVDFEELRTIEEADEAWSRVRRIVSDSAAERRNSLPTGQPEGLRAFADVASPRLTRYWRAFSEDDLYPGGYAWGGGTRTLVTVDEQDDGWHVCFMQDWNTPGVSVTNAIERLATAVHREACAVAERQASAPSRALRGWLARRRAAREPAALAPGRFHFYQHLPPHSDSLPGEQFDRVELTFRDGEFHDPEWSGYRVVPAAIQSARFDCALDASASGVQPRCLLMDSQGASGDQP